jgi:dTDP-4-dehydrorhamnose 3,5-epimerase
MYLVHVEDCSAGSRYPTGGAENHHAAAVWRRARPAFSSPPPNAQAKLVRCGRGRLLDVAVDIRVGSPTYGLWDRGELSFENGRQLFVPEGFLNGFVTLEADTEIIYKCSRYYAPQSDGAVRFDNPAIGIDWGITAADAVISDRDAGAPLLADLADSFVWDGV